MPATPVLPKLVGERVKRREDPRLIQGRGTFVDDVKIVGMQHIAFKRADIAHGRIVSIDRFGESAPGPEVLADLGITPEAVAEAARSLVT